jgi:hypothetical protein
MMASVCADAAFILKILVFCIAHIRPLDAPGKRSESDAMYYLIALRLFLLSTPRLAYDALLLTQVSVARHMGTEQAIASVPCRLGGFATYLPTTPPS